MTEKRNVPQLPERQTIRVPFFTGWGGDAEFRIQRDKTGDVKAMTVEGVASVYDYEYEVYGGPKNMGWVERIAKGAFDATLKEKPDVVLLLNHEGMPLARTKSGTLDLKAGKSGLEVRANLDTANPLVQTLSSALDRGDVDEMSFAFRVTKQDWQAHADFPDDEMSLRTITEVNLHRGDVSAVTYGASDATSIDVARSLRLANDDELQQYQALIAERLNRSQAAPDGMSERDTGGMPAHLVQMLRITPNPLLQEYSK